MAAERVTFLLLLLLLSLCLLPRSMCAIIRALPGHTNTRPSEGAALQHPAPVVRDATSAPPPSVRPPVRKTTPVLGVSRSSVSAAETLSAGRGSSYVPVLNLGTVTTPNRETKEIVAPVPRRSRLPSSASSDDQDRPATAYVPFNSLTLLRERMPPKDGHLKWPFFATRPADDGAEVTTASTELTTADSKETPQSVDAGESARNDNPADKKEDGVIVIATARQQSHVLGKTPAEATGVPNGSHNSQTVQNDSQQMTSEFNVSTATTRSAGESSAERTSKLVLGLTPKTQPSTRGPLFTSVNQKTENKMQPSIGNVTTDAVTSSRITLIYSNNGTTAVMNRNSESKQQLPYFSWVNSASEQNYKASQQNSPSESRLASQQTDESHSPHSSTNIEDTTTTQLAKKNIAVPEATEGRAEEVTTRTVATTSPHPSLYPVKVTASSPYRRQADERHRGNSTAMEHVTAETLSQSDRVAQSPSDAGAHKAASNSSSLPESSLISGHVSQSSAEQGPRHSSPGQGHPEQSEMMLSERHGYPVSPAPTISPQQLTALEAAYDYSDDYVDEELQLGDNGIAPPVALLPRPLLQALEWPYTQHKNGKPSSPDSVQKEKFTELFIPGLENVKSNFSQNEESNRNPVTDHDNQGPRVPDKPVLLSSANFQLTFKEDADEVKHASDQDIDQSNPNSDETAAPLVYTYTQFVGQTSESTDPPTQFSRRPESTTTPNKGTGIYSISLPWSVKHISFSSILPSTNDSKSNETVTLQSGVSETTRSPSYSRQTSPYRPTSEYITLRSQSPTRGTPRPQPGRVTPQLTVLSSDSTTRPERYGGIIETDDSYESDDQPFASLTGFAVSRRPAATVSRVSAGSTRPGPRGTPTRRGVTQSSFTRQRPPTATTEDPGRTVSGPSDFFLQAIRNQGHTSYSETATSPFPMLTSSAAAQPTRPSFNRRPTRPESSSIFFQQKTTRPYQSTPSPTFFTRRTTASPWPSSSLSTIFHRGTTRPKRPMASHSPDAPPTPPTPETTRPFTVFSRPADEPSGYPVTLRPLSCITRGSNTVCEPKPGGEGVTVRPRPTVVSRPDLALRPGSVFGGRPPTENQYLSRPLQDSDYELEEETAEELPRPLFGNDISRPGLIAGGGETSSFQNAAPHSASVSQGSHPGSGTKGGIFSSGLAALFSGGHTRRPALGNTQITHRPSHTVTLSSTGLTVHGAPLSPSTLSGSRWPPTPTRPQQDYDRPKPTTPRPYKPYMRPSTKPPPHLRPGEANTIRPSIIKSHPHPGYAAPMMYQESYTPQNGNEPSMTYPSNYRPIQDVTTTTTSTSTTTTTATFTTNISATASTTPASIITTTHSTSLNTESDPALHGYESPHVSDGSTNLHLHSHREPPEQHSYAVVNVWRKVQGELKLVGQQLVPVDQALATQLGNGALLGADQLPSHVISQLTDSLNLTNIQDSTKTSVQITAATLPVRDHTTTTVPPAAVPTATTSSYQSYDGGDQLEYFPMELGDDSGLKPTESSYLTYTSSSQHSDPENVANTYVTPTKQTPETVHLQLFNPSPNPVATTTPRPPTGFYDSLLFKFTQKPNGMDSLATTLKPQPSSTHVAVTSRPSFSQTNVLLNLPSFSNSPLGNIPPNFQQYFQPAKSSTQKPPLASPDGFLLAGFIGHPVSSSQLAPHQQEKPATTDPKPTESSYLSYDAPWNTRLDIPAEGHEDQSSQISAPETEQLTVNFNDHKPNVPPPEIISLLQATQAQQPASRPNQHVISTVTNASMNLLPPQILQLLKRLKKPMGSGNHTLLSLFGGQQETNLHVNGANVGVTKGSIGVQVNQFDVSHDSDNDYPATTSVYSQPNAEMYTTTGQHHAQAVSGIMNLLQPSRSTMSQYTTKSMFKNEHDNDQNFNINEEKKIFGGVGNPSLEGISEVKVAGYPVDRATQAMLLLEALKKRTAETEATQSPQQYTYLNLSPVGQSKPINLTQLLQIVVPQESTTDSSVNNNQELQKSDLAPHIHSSENDKNIMSNPYQTPLSHVSTSHKSPTKPSHSHEYHHKVGAYQTAQQQTRPGSFTQHQEQSGQGSAQTNVQHVTTPRPTRRSPSRPATTHRRPVLMGGSGQSQSTLQALGDRLGVNNPQLLAAIMLSMLPTVAIALPVLGRRKRDTAREKTGGNLKLENGRGGALELALSTSKDRYTTAGTKSVQGGVLITEEDRQNANTEQGTHGNRHPWREEGTRYNLRIRQDHDSAPKASRTGLGLDLDSLQLIPNMQTEMRDKHPALLAQFQQFGQRIKTKLAEVDPERTRTKTVQQQKQQAFILSEEWKEGYEAGKRVNVKQHAQKLITWLNRVLDVPAGYNNHLREELMGTTHVPERTNRR